MLEVWWTTTHRHDQGAYEKEDPITELFYEKTEGETFNPENPNRKVNLDKPLVRERASKHVIIDVTNLKLEDAQQLEFLFALVDYYESNYWITFKSLGIVSWFVVSFIMSVISYFMYGMREDKNSWLDKFFALLDLID